MKTTQFNIQFRRKREGRTDYSKRLFMLKAKRPRLVVRKSLRCLVLQVVEFDAKGDKIVAGFNTSSLKKHGWKYSTSSLPAAYLGGLMLGKLAQAKHLKEAVLDIGMLTSVKGSKIYAAVKGAIDAGLTIPCNKEMFPSEDRISGKHIVDYSKSSKTSTQFNVLKNQNLCDIVKEFTTLKQKIIKGN
jgi:large subunit ribosomal protein L18